LESRWLINRVLLGLSQIPHGVKLARLLGTEPLYGYVQSGDRASGICNVFVYVTDPLVSGQQPNFTNTVDKPDGAGSPFPYGFATEPDH
jgi:hypothetical protein